MQSPQTTPVPIRPDGLQIDEDRAFQERFWTAQRILWVALTLIPLAALTGATGRSGPLAKSHALIGAAEVTFPRIARLGGSSSITLTLPDGTAPELTLGPDLASHFQIEAVLPRPAMETGGGLIRMAFFPDKAAPYRITVSLRATAAGIARYNIGSGAESIGATTVVLP